MWKVVSEVVGDGLGGTAVLLIATVILLVVLHLATRPNNYPPGLPTIPILGSLPFTGGNVTRSLIRSLKKKYGDLACFSIFNQRVVLVSNLKNIKEVFSNLQAAGRPQVLFITARNNVLTEGRHNAVGILASSGEQWQEQRRFVLRHLRDLGFGKTSMEPLMLQEIRELVDHLKQQGEEPVVMQRFFGRSVINLIWGMVAGKRYPYGHAKLTKLLKTFVTPSDVNLLSPLHFLPGAMRLAPHLPLLKTQVKPVINIANFIKEEIKEYQQARAEGKEDEDCLVSVYLKEIEQREGVNSTFHLDQLLAVIFEMFVAGSETTSSTLTMGIYQVAKHRHVQDRLHEELDRVVGTDPDVFPSFDQMEQLPYTQAAIHEVQRLFRLVPYSLPHQALQDLTIKGYNIPKGTILIANMEDCLMDPALWKNPDAFDPTNFLDQDGKYKRNEAFMPFGSGKRQCVGEPLARLELFLFFSCIMHRFSFSIATEEEVANENPLFTPTPIYTVKVTPRF